MIQQGIKASWPVSENEIGTPALLLSIEQCAVEEWRILDFSPWSKSSNAWYDYFYHEAAATGATREFSLLAALLLRNRTPWLLQIQHCKHYDTASGAEGQSQGRSVARRLYFLYLLRNENLALCVLWYLNFSTLQTGQRLIALLGNQKWTMEGAKKKAENFLCFFLFCRMVPGSPHAVLRTSQWAFSCGRNTCDEGTGTLKWKQRKI